ncbi:NAD(P)-binding protein [Tilletiopsis washingtonensis]|uniref:NAD(P)-binding protein n=1 Tax=Tilletiopsis washingtonensis TaxID=58919 RepID=A0A316ZA85_9BASI|nr:NAD(P)-binding protein [Tilletiopsis washingtonensis]PWN97175.1 NAD(P)-binding protein [Tilletiopsis washingtonensis]
MSFLRTAASRSLRTALPRAAVPRVAAPRVATASNSFVTWAPTSEPKVSAVQQNPGPPPPPENIGVDAVLRQNPNDPEAHTTTIFSEFSLAGKTAVVTGGNGGLGLEMALAFVEAGAHVYAIDVPEMPGEEFKIVAEHCRIMSRDLKYISASVTDDKEINDVMEFIVGDSGTGTLDICVAAAGILGTHDALVYPVEDFKKIFDVNTTGVFLTARAAARQMYKQKEVKGSIILIASMSGSIVNRDHHWVAYNASKSAVLQMGRNLAAEWGPHDIRVNCISPGHIRTRMTSVYLDENPHLLAKWSGSNPLGRIGRSAEMRGVAVWLASPASSFCNGSDVIVSGGHQIW